MLTLFGVCLPYKQLSLLSCDPKAFCTSHLQ